MKEEQKEHTHLLKSEVPSRSFIFSGINLESGVQIQILRNFGFENPAFGVLYYTSELKAIERTPVKEMPLWLLFFSIRDLCFLLHHQLPAIRLPVFDYMHVVESGRNSC